MDKTSRALRRHHRARLIRKYMNYDMVRWRAFEEDSEENRRHRATRLVDHIAMCSCMMCRNERRCGWLHEYDRLTMQEKKALDDYHAQMQELVD